MNTTRTARYEHEIVTLAAARVEALCAEWAAARAELDRLGAAADVAYNAIPRHRLGERYRFWDSDDPAAVAFQAAADVNDHAVDLLEGAISYAVWARIGRRLAGLGLRATVRTVVAHPCGEPVVTVWIGRRPPRGHVRSKAPLHGGLCVEVPWSGAHALPDVLAPLAAALPPVPA